MEDVKKLIQRLDDEAILSYTLLSAFEALHYSHNLCTMAGKQAIVLDFSHELELLTVMLAKMNVSYDDALANRDNGIWF